MKKFFMIIVAFLLLSSCGNNSNSNTNGKQNVNVRVSESSDGWEYLESVDAAYPSSERAKQDVHPASSGAYLTIMYIYVRIAAGERYIGATMNRNNNPKVVSINPFYNDGTDWGKYQYRVKYYDGKYYFFNL